MKRLEFTIAVGGSITGAASLTLMPSFSLARGEQEPGNAGMHLAEAHWDPLTDDDASYLLRHSVMNCEVDIRKKNARQR